MSLLDVLLRAIVGCMLLVPDQATEDAIALQGHSVFDVIDADRDGRLSLDEVKDTFSKLGRDDELSPFLEMVPMQGNGIGLSDFQHWWREEAREAAEIPTTTAGTTTPAPVGHCGARDSGPWANLSACINNQPIGNQFATTGWMWHCPWESMMLVSARGWGGCPKFKYDCLSTNVPALIEKYRLSDTLGPNHAPEGNLETVEYVLCCLESQCHGKPLPQCGEAPITNKSKLAKPSANPCGHEGCERRLSSTASVFNSLSNHAYLVAACSAMGVLAGVLVMARGPAANNKELLSGDTYA